MKVVEWPEFLHEGMRGVENAAITVGVFDGIHIGHQKLTEKIQRYAAGRDGTEAVVFTFMNNPSAFFHPNRFLGNITTIEQKLRLFRKMGLEHLVLIDFSVDFSKLTGNDFFSILKFHLVLW